MMTIVLQDVVFRSAPRRALLTLLLPWKRSKEENDFVHTAQIWCQEHLTFGTNTAIKASNTATVSSAEEVGGADSDVAPPLVHDHNYMHSYYY